MRSYQFIICLLTVGVFFSCDNPEPNCSLYQKNADLKKFPTDTKIHQAKLKELMVENKDELEFFFAGKQQGLGVEYLLSGQLLRSIFLRKS